MKTKFLPTLLACCIATACNTFASQDENDDFLELSLEELISLDIPDVTSVSRKKQRLMDSAAAIYVITDEDIHRSGVTSIPEALRMVPGMQVAKLNSNTWSISTRGFNYIFANKLLVLIDGRTVYSPLFSGVNWDVQDTLMEDIDRIEVIRGPGAALWGANAVNGVINVITKKAADTQGTLVTLGGGSEEKAFGSYRYGGEFGDTGFYKVYVKAFERDGQANADGSDAADDWKMRRAGFKTEWDVTSDSEITVQGELYDGTTRPPLRIYDKTQPTKGAHIVTDKDRDQRGGNLGAYWKRTLSDTNDYSLRLIYDNYQNFDYRIAEKRDTVDLEFQHYSQLWDKHDLVWGLGYRTTWYEVDSTQFMYLAGGKTSRKTRLFSAFIQDDITLNEQWTFTLSSRFEHNSFTGDEIQPNARLTWKATENRTFWSALSRAVKTPSISETSLQTEGVTIANGGVVDYLIPIQGLKDLQSEKLTAFELGYREQFSSSFRLDITAFYNQYEDIVAYVGSPKCPDGTPAFNSNGTYICPLPAGTPPTLIQIPTVLTNGLNARTYGLELVADWQAKDWWKLQFNYSWLQVDARPSGTPTDFIKSNEHIVESLSASNTANIRSTMNLPDKWYFDFWVRYMDNLKNAQVEAHTSLDVRLAKKYGNNLEFSIVGQNLFRDQRQEFLETLSGMAPTQVQESWYAQIRWQY